MKKLLLFGLLIMVFLAVNVEGALTDGNTVYYSWDTGNYSGNNIYDLSGAPVFNGTNVGATLGAVQGVLNWSSRFDGANDYMRTGITNVPNQNTFNYWFQKQGAQANLDAFLGINTGGNLILFVEKTGGEVSYRFSDGNSLYLTVTNATLFNGSWHMVTVRTNFTDDTVQVFYDGNLQTNVVYQFQNNVAPHVLPDDFYIGAQNDGADPPINFIQGDIDEFGYWNKSLTVAEINELYNNGTGYNPYSGGGIPPAGDSLNITFVAPVNNDNWNTNPVQFNVSVDSNSTFNCSLWINGSMNATQSGSSPSDNLSFNIDLGLGAWSWYFNCTNGYTNGTETSAPRTVYFDDTDPMITSILNPNGRVFFQNNLTGQWNFTDNFYLHSYNTTIDGVQIDYQVISGTNYLYNLSYNVSSLTPGTHTLGVRLADGHTAKELGGDYIVSDGLWNRYLKYEFWDEGEVQIRGLPDSIFDEFTTEKQTDRYTFTYEPADIQNEYSFEVNSDMPIHIVNKPDSEIKTWIIMGNHWMDFYLANEPAATINIESIDEFNVRVTVGNLQFPSSQVYSSIGDLNIVFVNYTFAVANATLSYSPVVSELQSQTLSFRINTTSPLITGTTALLYYNNTLTGTTKTVNVDNDFYTVTFLTPGINPTTANVTIRWDYNITGINNSEVGNVTVNQTIVRIGIDNCSTYTTRAYNISLFDESDDSPLNGSISGYFQVWVSAIGSYRAFNLSWNGNSTYGLCINPASATYLASAQIEYDSLGYESKTYYWTNTTLNNVTNQLNLYLINNTAQVTFTVSDENDDAIQGAYIHVASYDLGTDSYKTTEILKTGSEGEAYGQMVLNTKWYKFFIYYQGQLELETIATKITTTTKNFRINLGTDFFPDYNKILNSVCRVTFNNATNNFNFVFSESTGAVTKGCLEVIQRTINNDIVINNSCLSSASGNIIVGLGVSPANDTFIGTGTLYIGNVTYTCGSVTHSLNNRFKVFGDNGMFLTFLVVLTLTLVGIASPVIAITLALFGAVFMVIFGLWFLSWPILITMVILGIITIIKLSRNK